MYGKPPLDELTHHYYALTFCELAQLVVDPLLHALQVVRYMELAQGGAGRCGAWIMITLLNTFDV